MPEFIHVDGRNHTYIMQIADHIGWTERLWYKPTFFYLLVGENGGGKCFNPQTWPNYAAAVNVLLELKVRRKYVTMYRNYNVYMVQQK